MALRTLTHEEPLGRYRLVAQLGHGGLGEVFVARRAGADGAGELVAVKRMRASLARDRALAAMFLHEGRVAAELAHPNICQVLELGEVDDAPFLAMELLFGLPWSEIVPKLPDRPVETRVRFVVGVAVQACEGLHHAHAAAGADQPPRPVLHRDVSPGNLFVTSEGCVKLLDFGVSKVLTEATTTGDARSAKLPYLAPEQLHDTPVDVRADLFSLGVVTWEALAGRARFDRRSDHEIRQAVAHAEIPALPGEGPVRARLEAVLRRATARDRTERHGSAHELAGDLRGAIAACGEPMAPSEIAAQLATWLGPSLARRVRDLAELGAETGSRVAAAGEPTAPHPPAPVAGVRLRERSVVVGGAALDGGGIIDDVAPTLPAGAPVAPPLDAERPALNGDAAPRDRRHRGAVPSSGDILGKYRLGKKLGEGAFGLVFIARDTGLDRDVALKFLRAHHASNPQVVERFLQEARAAGKLSHPGIVTVYELGTARDGTVFIAMELLRGESLHDRLRRVGRLPSDAALEICRQIASVLQAAHQAGIVHRDLKPDNIFLAVDPTMPGGERVKVLDFGIAKLASAEATSIQTGSLVIGTPRYMSPEQCSSSAGVDHRSDIYALGCILYELVCGRALFDGAVGEIIAKHQLVEPPAARERVPELAPALDRLISWMLAKDPGQRPQTMERVETEITGGLAGVTSVAVVPGRTRRPDTAGLPADSPAARPAQDRTTLSGSTNSMAAPASRRRAGVVLTTGVVLAGVVAAIVVTRTPDSPAPVPPAGPPPPAAPAAMASPPATGPSPVAASASPAAEPRAPDPVPADAGAANPAGAEPAAPVRQLTPDSIAAAVRSEHAAELQRCYARLAKASRDASQRLVVTLHVAATGRVVDYQTDPPMTGCKVLASMRFAADGAVDDPSRRVTAEIVFDYPSVPLPSRGGAPARAPRSCPPGTVWKPSESACVAPPDRKPCPPIKDRMIDPFGEDPCRQ